MKFEDLPNEIFPLIFDFLYCDQIISSFDELNSRFSSLLYFYSNYYHELTRVNIKSIEKYSSNIKCLTLSDENHSCINVKQFLSIYPIELFYAKLEILSINLTTNLLFLLPNFEKLKYFCLSSFNHRSFCQNIEEEEQIYEIILFQIKTLKHFQCNIRLPLYNSIKLNLSSIKSSIEYFQFFNLSFNRIEYLYMNTTKLKSVSIRIPSLSYYPFQLEKPFDQLISLKLNHVNSKVTFNLLFYHIAIFSQLKRLELQGSFSYEKDFIDGERFEHLIQHCLLNLKIFRLFFIIYNWNNSLNINDFSKSFSTDFWLIEKQWFITFNYQIQLNRLYLYTNPCIETSFEYITPCIEISTRRKQIAISNIQWLTLSEISQDLTYEQLNRCVDLSSIRSFEWKSKINLKLFFEILKYKSSELFLKINYDRLSQIIEQHKKSLFYFQNIKSLEINFICLTKIQQKSLQNLTSYFPNIEKLILIGDFLISQIIYLINHLNHLTLLIIHANKCPRISETVIRNSLSTNISYRSYKDTVYLWICHQDNHF